jgi:hypothetical protein
VGIEFAVTATEAVLSINGPEIDCIPGDYSSVDQPFYIEAQNGPVELKSVKVVG